MKNFIGSILFFAAVHAHAFIFFGGGSTASSVYHADNLDNGVGTNVVLSGQFYFDDTNAIAMNGNDASFRVFYRGPDLYLSNASVYLVGSNAYYENADTNAAVIYFGKMRFSSFNTSNVWNYYNADPFSSEYKSSLFGTWFNFQIRQHQSAPVNRSYLTDKILSGDGSSFTNLNYSALSGVPVNLDLFTYNETGNPIQTMSLGDRKIRYSANTNTDLIFPDAVRAYSFIGSGASLTGIDASQITGLGSLATSSTVTSNNILGKINIGQIDGAAKTVSLGFASGGMGLTVPAVYSGAAFYANGLNYGLPSAQSVNNYSGCPISTGTYTNLKVNWYFPAVASTNDITFILVTNGVLSGLQAKLKGALGANSKSFTNSGTASVTITDPSCLAHLLITNNSGSSISGVYLGWSCDVIK